MKFELGKNAYAPSEGVLFKNKGYLESNFLVGDLLEVTLETNATVQGRVLAGYRGIYIGRNDTKALRLPRVLKGGTPTYVLATSVKRVI